MTTITLHQVSKQLGSITAVDRVDLSVPPGELCFILGPSGSGKSTLLNLVAGLLQPSSGTISFDGRDVTQVPTAARNAVLCFQSYALWPHLTVEKNVQFGLETRGIDRQTSLRRVAEALDQVQLRGLELRYPSELSGGQQQRVALARALVVRPACLLLDEPLSNLDARLRHQMRSDIRRICKDSGLTTLYVTHDQKEALSVADRIAVMHNGRLEQADNPTTLFTQPRTPFVAGFIAQANVFKARVLEADATSTLVQAAFGTLRSSADTTFTPTVGQDVYMAIRPDQLKLDSAQRSAPNTFVARCLESLFLGEWSEHRLRVEGPAAPALELRASVSPARANLEGELSLQLPAQHLLVLPDTDGYGP